MNIKIWSPEPIQTWSSLCELVKIRKTAIKPAWLLITLVIELSRCAFSEGVYGIWTPALL